jgi:beta-galactosidase/beta-glucuronidase
MLPPLLAAAAAFVACAAAAATVSAAQVPAARQVLSLDGAGWALQLDPSDPTVQKMVQENCSACTSCKSCTNLNVGGSVSVPGAWAAQGFGEETAALKTQYFGLATYSRLVAVPPAFRVAGRTVWLVVERPQRSVSVKANGLFVGNHTGYLGKFEGEVTNFMDGNLNLSLAVDAKQGPTDGLVGCSDFGPDGIPIRGWGGIGGHVRLESRPKAWIVDPHIQHGVSASLDSATINASITIGGGGGGGGLSLRVTYAISATNATVGQVHATCSSANVCNVSNIAVNAPQLWSPRSPVLHIALVQLIDSTGAIYDSVSVRFGLKRFEIVGIHWKLNGEWLYLHGYGDDSIYPMSIAPPLNFSFYLERLTIAKGLGFNYVRHHTNVLPDEYFAAACAVGIMVQAEFPMFGGRDGCSGATFACDKNAVYFEEWRATILRLRNHPCVFDYTMNNEGPLENHEFAMTLYNMAKKLDPSRLVSTSDGISDDGNSNHSASQGNTSQDNPFDFLTPGYGEATVLQFH